MKSFIYKYAIRALLMVIFLTSSCSASPANEDSTPATETPESIFEIKTPSSVMPTPIPTLQLTSPALPSTQVSEIINNLYADNGGCELPCLWGIVPGKTSVQDVYVQFSQIGYFEDQTRTVDHFQVIAFATSVSPVDSASPYNNNVWGFGMRVEKRLEVIEGLNIRAVNIKEFSTPSLLKFLAYFGEPEEIRVRIIESMVLDENPDYEVALYYPTKGIFIRWRGETDFVISQTEKNIKVMACPQYMPTEADTLKGSSPPFFYLFSPNENMPFNEIIKTHLSEDPSGSYQPLDKVNIEEFYTMYSNPTSEDCFPFDYSFSP
jgi:hypothetical protein